MLRRERSPDIDKRISINAELNQLHLRLNLSLGKVATLSLGDILGLGNANAELKGGVTVLILSPLGDNLTAVNLKHGNRNMYSVLSEEAGHAEFLGNETGTHRLVLAFTA
jgi:hypothetical protein